MTPPKIYSNHFYAWEKQYRGHTIADQQVSIQPVFNYFKPFDHATGVTKDDSLAPTYFEALSSFIKKKYSQLIKLSPAENSDSRTIITKPKTKSFVFFRIYVPHDVAIKHQEFASFLEMLSIQTGTVSFEIIATDQKILLLFSCAASYVDTFISLTSSFLPDLIVQRIYDDPLSAFAKTNNIDIIEFAPRYEFIRPLRFIEQCQTDPFVPIFSSLENLQHDEQVVLQILFHISDKPWKETIMHALHNSLGQQFFYHDPQMISCAEQKCLHKQFGSIIRTAVCAHASNRKYALKESITNTLIQSTASTSNQLQAFNCNASDYTSCILDLVNRSTHRKPFVCNSHELLSLVHAPSTAVVSKKYRTAFTRTKAVPEALQNHAFVLGKNIHGGIETNVTINCSERGRHFYISGSTGLGKSTLLLSMIRENLRLGEGVAVIDVHGQLVDTVLQYIPDNRKNDVIILDPSDQEFSFSLNLLSAHSERQKEVLASEIVANFRKHSLSWGDSLNSIFKNAIAVFLYSSDGGTLADVRKFLLDSDFRKITLSKVEDPQLVYYWQHEFPLLRSTSVAAILTRLDTFISSKAIRNMVCQPQGFDFEGLLNDRRILLARLSHGLIGADNAYLLGSLLITKIYQAALAREDTKNRNDFFTYIDEAHFLMKGANSVLELLSGARKYNVSLIAATQSLSQISEPEVVDAILTNAAIRICFRLGDSDAKKLSEGFSSFTPYDLQNLKVGEAICRVDRPEQDFSLTVSLPREPVNDEHAISEMLEQSRKRHCVRRATAERWLLESISKSSDSNTNENDAKDTFNISHQDTTDTIESRDADSNFGMADIKQDTKKLGHREMQMQIKTIAEQFGFVAKIEQQLADGSGQVDVLLCKDEKTIAVEISVSTGKKWEVHNIEKCIAAKYDVVISLGQSQRQVQQIKNEFEQIKLQTTTPVYFFTIETFYAFMQKEKISPASNQTLGYRVNVSYGKTN